MPQGDSSINARVTPASVAEPEQVTRAENGLAAPSLSSAESAADVFKQMTQGNIRELRAGQMAPPVPDATGIGEVLWSFDVIKAKWQSRSAATKESSSASWQYDQLRFIFLLTFPQIEREAIFADLACINDWTQKSQQKYWSAFLAGVKAIGGHVGPGAFAMSSMLHFLANEEKSLNETYPMLPTELEAVCAHLVDEDPALELSLRVAYVLGQRLGDIFNLQVEDIGELLDPLTGCTFVYLTFRQTKTSRRTQPYTLHIRKNTPTAARQFVGMSMSKEADLATALFKFARERKGQEYLFASVAEKLPLMKKIGASLRLVHAELNVLSVRRGGLQVMALSGMSTATLLAHSRHTTEKTLHRYLGWGKLFLGPARERFGAIAIEGRALELIRQGSVLVARELGELSLMPHEKHGEHTTSA